eukprot:6206076-Pleurochrysis_carterae.AAC.3
MQVLQQAEREAFRQGTEAFKARPSHGRYTTSLAVANVPTITHTLTVTSTLAVTSTLMMVPLLLQVDSSKPQAPCSHTLARRRPGNRVFRS